MDNRAFEIVLTMNEQLRALQEDVAALRRERREPVSSYWQLARTRSLRLTAQDRSFELRSDYATVLRPSAIAYLAMSYPNGLTTLKMSSPGHLLVDVEPERLARSVQLRWPAGNLASLFLPLPLTIEWDAPDGELAHMAISLEYGIVELVTPHV